jgi:hypothetical protein
VPHPDTGRDWRHTLAETALMWAFAIAALRRCDDSRDTPAAILAACRFEDALAQARSAGSREQAMPAPADLTAAAVTYAEQIGDIQQSLPGEETATDPLLAADYQGEA